MPKITFPTDEVIIVDGMDFLELTRKYPSLPIRFGCRRGQCGTCAIRIDKGSENLTAISQEEEKTLHKKGFDSCYRLACQCAINGDITIAASVSSD